jgi:hypothetical protein
MTRVRVCSGALNGGVGDGKNATKLDNKELDKLLVRCVRVHDVAISVAL